MLTRVSAGIRFDYIAESVLGGGGGNALVRQHWTSVARWGELLLCVKRRRSVGRRSRKRRRPSVIVIVRRA